MKLYEFENDNLVLPVPPFDSKEWYLSIAQMIVPRLITMYGDRETIDSPKIVMAWREYSYGIRSLDYVHEVTLSEMQKRIQYELFAKNRSYEVIYTALTEEFNPLWNVDGTETLTYERKNTGTQTNVLDKDDKNTGTQTNTDTTSNTSTDSTTTYDSGTWKDTNKNVSSNSGAVTRTDNLTYTSDETDTRTDNLTERYTETKTRGGNIGTTKTTDLQRDAIDLFTLYDFLDIVVHDIANVCTCRTY